MIAHYPILSSLGLSSLGLSSSAQPSFNQPVFRALFKFSLLSLLLFITAPGLSQSAAAKTTTRPATILVSIKPLHSLISHITEGINRTELLLQQQQSPHHFQLRPSQKRLLNQAEFFFYSSDNLEGFVSALKNTNDNLQFIELSRIPKIQILAARSFHAEHAHKTQSKIDGHIWLSVNNAKAIAEYVTQLLSQRSPENAIHYQQNLGALLIKLDNLQQQNRQQLSPYQSIPYLVYHDAFQYFEQENGLNNAHFITTNPEHSPGIKRVKALREIIHTKNIQCIFYEPPNIPSLLNTLTEKTSVILAELDPAGSQLPMGKSHYFKLMRQTATTLSTCFSKK